MDILDEREQAEVNFAQSYIDNFNHGTSGHLSYSVIAKMASMLNQFESQPHTADSYAITVDGKPYTIWRQMITAYELLNLTGRSPEKYNLVMVDLSMKPSDIPLSVHDMISLHNRNEVFKTLRK